MLKALLLILVLVSSFAFAQSENKEAYKIDEFGTLTECDLGNRLERSFREFYSAPNSKTQVIFYQGFNDSKREHLRKLRFVKRGIAFLQEVSNPQISSESVEIVEAGYKKDFSVQLWIIPKGAEPPNPFDGAFLFDKFGLISEKTLKAKFSELGKRIDGKCLDRILIYLYGNKNTTDRLLKKYGEYISQSNQCDIEGLRLTVSFGGFSKKQKTEIWIVPPGAEAPAPNPNRK